MKKLLVAVTVGLLMLLSHALCEGGFQMEGEPLIPAVELQENNETPAADVVPENRIAMGSVGEQVTILQIYLKELGYYGGEIDGGFGPLTSNAIQKYQADRELPITESVDEDLLKRMKAEYKDNKTHVPLGTNILNNTAKPKISNAESIYELGTWRYASGGTGTREMVTLNSSPVAGVKAGIRFVSNPNDGSTAIAIDSVPVEFDQVYVLSCYIRGIGTAHLQHGKDGWVRKDFVASDKWQRVSYAFQVGAKNDGSTKDSPFTNVYFGIGAGESETFDITMCAFKLEKAGPSAWSN